MQGSDVLDQVKCSEKKELDSAPVGESGFGLLVLAQNSAEVLYWPHGSMQAVGNVL